MARFILVNARRNPLQVLVNVERIVRVSPSGAGSMLFLDDGTDELDRLEVTEIIPELQRLLNGEPPAASVKAHPGAIGRVQHPELKS